LRSFHHVWLALSVTAALGACQSGPLDPSTSSSDDPAPSRIGPEETLHQSIDQLRLAFQPTEDGFRAGFDTHDAIVTGRDLVMVPYHYDGAQTIEGAPVKLATTSILRGAVNLDTGVSAARLGRSGAVEIDRGAVTEIFENRDDGVEQSWRFAADPGGDDDLVVTVAVTGHQRVATTRTGLHFLNGDRLGISYSQATWIDATRNSWPVPVRWDGQQIEMRVPSAVLDRSVYPAVLDPVIGAESGVDSQVNGFPGGAASSPSLSHGSGTNYLAVWTDGRNGAGHETDIWAARVRADGTPIGANISVARSVILEHQPVVTWTGTEWLLAWTREDVINAGVAAARVSTTGVVTSLGIIANTFRFESRPALASTGGGNALLVYQANSDIFAHRYSGGAFSASFVVADTADLEANPTVAGSTGGNYLVAWENGADPGQDIFGRLIAPSNPNPAAFPIAAVDGSLDQPAAAFNGTRYVLVWRRGNLDIWGTRIATDGTVLDTTGTEGGVEISATPDAQSDPAVACSQTQCIVAFADRRDPTTTGAAANDLVAQRYAFDWTPNGGEIVISDFLRSQDEPSLVGAGGGGFLAAWTDNRTLSSVVFATAITSTGVVSSPNGELVNTAVKNAQTHPSDAPGTTTHLAVWSDSRSFGDDIRARRYDLSGNRLDADSLSVSDAEWEQSAPAVSFDGSQYVVAWRDGRNIDGDIFAARVQEDGTLSDANGIEVTAAEDHQIAPDIASGGGVSLVVWRDRFLPGTGADILGAIVSADGSVSAPIAICQEENDQVQPSIAWDPNSSLFVVAWSDQRDGVGDIYAARVDPDGTVLDPCGAPVSLAANAQQVPDVAVSGTQVLIVWEEYRDDVFGDIWGGRITTTGGAITRLDGNGVPIATGASFQTGPTTVGVGLGRWGIAWTDTINTNTAGTDILGNTMAPDGTLSIEPEYLISGGVFFETGASFQSGGGDSNQVFLMYDYNRPSTGSLRIKRRRITY
jgi:large repetitive protein